MAVVDLFELLRVSVGYRRTTVEEEHKITMKDIVFDNSCLKVHIADTLFLK